MKKYIVKANYYHADGFKNPMRNQTDRIKQRIHNSEVTVGEFLTYKDAKDYIDKECKTLAKRKNGRVVYADYGVKPVYVTALKTDKILSGEYYITEVD